MTATGASGRLPESSAFQPPPTQRLTLGNTEKSLDFVNKPFRVSLI